MKHNNIRIIGIREVEEEEQEIENLFEKVMMGICEAGGNIGGSGIHFPSTPGKYLADLRSRANSQQYSSIYEDQRPKIEDTERSDGKKSAQGQ